ncbi:MAG: acyl transferase [Cyclobacteriaceae bacterium]|nr:acyl transferase [Cyclobacteriaceae bacterium]
MDFINSFKSKIFKTNIQNFHDHALSLFYWQAEHNNTYRQYLECLGCYPHNIHDIEAIPFLPIQFFKSHHVRAGEYEAKTIFSSSGTTGVAVSKHAMEDVSFYHNVSEMAFTRVFGELNGSVVLGLLPSYLERNNSSLVAMVDHFIHLTKHPDSGFYLHEYSKLYQVLVKLKSTNSHVFLFGVTFALLDFASKFTIDMPNLTILETGGMKGKGKELVRDELHEVLRQSFKNSRISSEYGMTELMSQAYMLGDGFFHPPPWMKVLIRDQYDPFTILPPERHGGLNIIDLANIHSCAFIESEDLGISGGERFKVLGRMDNSDIRGCNLLV